MSIEMRKKLFKATRKSLQISATSAVCLYLWKITLNVNGLNHPVKRYRMPGWIKKKSTKQKTQNLNPKVCCLQETHFTTRDLPRLEMKVWEKICSAKGTKSVWE